LDIYRQSEQSEEGEKWREDNRKRELAKSDKDDY
jgi:hypothetical protein